MQRQVVRSRNGETVVEYEDCGPGRARQRGPSLPGYLPAVPNGGRTMMMVNGLAGDFTFPHPASQVTRQPGEKVRR